jgi:transposase
MAMQVSKEIIDFFSGQIRRIEKAVLKKTRLRKPFQYLHTIPGVGNILALTIMLETGSIERFRKAGNYSSYCRKVPTKWTSNDKVKGRGNKKNGNKYLAWAFSEAAEFSRRHDERVRTWYNRKAAKTNSMIAHSALASKLSRAAWYIMKNHEPYDPDKCFV